MIDVKEMLIKSQTIFKQEMFEYKTESGDMLMCSIKDAFADFYSHGHNCLSCNLQEDAELIDVFLSSAGIIYCNEKDFFVIYIMLLYLLTEKIFEIKKIIGLPESYKAKDFEVLRTIKLWANFYKHPKAFILTHHPKYYFDTDPEVVELRKDINNKIIDLPFLNKYYKGEDKNKYKNLVSELMKNENVKVVIPSIDNLTHEFCNACAVFIKIIKENKAYREILNDLTTLEYYFEKEYKTRD